MKRVGSPGHLKQPRKGMPFVKNGSKNADQDENMFLEVSDEFCQIQDDLSENNTDVLPVIKNLQPSFQFDVIEDEFMKVRNLCKSACK